MTGTEDLTNYTGSTATLTYSGFFTSDTSDRRTFWISAAGNFSGGFSAFFDYAFAMVQAENRVTFSAFVCSLCRPVDAFKSRRIVRRALNSFRLAASHIHQPCWRRGRWKSKT